MSPKAKIAKVHRKKINSFFTFNKRYILDTARNIYPSAHSTSGVASSLLTLIVQAVFSLTQKASAKRGSELLVRKPIVGGAVGSSVDNIKGLIKETFSRFGKLIKLKRKIVQICKFLL